ncbi:DUF4124 domain-containing protein [Acidovorax lacteus]|uniref:DUF4124 domain-containing protein n=1 Tax=Acidovorax lacteus TaxID=1924988 RepID=A0ABP8LCM5_9BURK
MPIAPRRRTLAIVLTLLAAAAVAAALTADRWTPQAGVWLQQGWQALTGAGSAPASRTGASAATGRATSAPSPAPAPADAASVSAPRPRKCVQGGSVLYTDQSCPPGSTEQALEGGSITLMPR